MDFYFVYRHIRVDNGETFYVGCGKRPKVIKNTKSYYSRAYQIGIRRSIEWNEIHKQTDFTVDILFETTDKKTAYAKEAEYIKLYGRKCTGEGTLVNIVPSQGGVLKNPEIRITQLDINGNFVKIWNRPKDIANELGYLQSNIIGVCRKRALKAYGFLWEYTDNRDFDNVFPFAGRVKNPEYNRKGIILNNCETGEKKIFRRQLDVAKYLSVKRHVVRKALSNGTLIHNFIITHRIKI